MLSAVLCVLIGHEEVLDMETRYVSTKTASRVFQLSKRYLESLRSEGSGPPFVKVGKRVLYKVTDFETWLETSGKKRGSE
jgi:hypothetical protein